MRTLIVALIMVVMAFAVNVFAEPKIENAFVDLSTQPMSSIEDVVDSKSYKDLDLSFNARLMFTDKLGIEGVVGVPLSEIDENNLTYHVSIFGRLEYKKIGIEPYLSYSDNQVEERYLVGARAGLINRR